MYDAHELWTERHHQQTGIWRKWDRLKYGTLEKLRLLERTGRYGRKLVSASYILVAQKRTVVMTPLKEMARRRRQLFPVGIPSSSQGNVRRAS